MWMQAAAHLTVTAASGRLLANCGFECMFNVDDMLAGVMIGVPCVGLVLITVFG